MPVGTSRAFTTTLDNSFPLSGVTVCCEVVGVTVLDCEGVGFTVTLDNSFPLSGATVLAAVPAVTVLVWLGVGFTVTFFIVLPDVGVTVTADVPAVTIFSSSGLPAPHLKYAIMTSPRLSH